MGGRDLYRTRCDESITAKQGEDHQHQQQQHHHHLFTDSIMKTLCFTLGLLLLTICCCNAIPTALKFNTQPVNCCFSVYNNSIPLKFVSSITKTHRSCQTQAFIVQTIKGRQICYDETFGWALRAYNRFHNTEGSGQLH
ncbi:C-C motif chemokine 3-like [Centropristis striata]|uniref:C-C motif chemokine 3-like n=1 Tax=Centropristis striata TaxID=184440 RepID=UPI0027DECB1F|nr:C-C motif chemokine 3-like [Centropristis striata]